MELRKNKKIYIAFMLLALTLLIAITSAVYAKYTTREEKKDNQVKADPFYFTSNLLDGADTERTVEIYGKNASIPFTVQNYVDDGHVNQDDITYSISMSTSLSGVELKMVGDSGILEDLPTSPKLAGATQGVDQYTLELTNATFNDSDTITVTIASKRNSDGSGYIKTLKLNFVLRHANPNNLQYIIEDSNIYTRLIVMSNIAIDAKNIEIDWSDINGDGRGHIFQVDCTSRYVLDEISDTSNPNKRSFALTTNNPATTTEGYLNSCTVTQPIKSMQSFSIIFYKMKGETFSCVSEQGKITVDGETRYVATEIADSDTGETTYTITLKYEAKNPTPSAP